MICAKGPGLPALVFERSCMKALVSLASVQGAGVYEHLVLRHIARSRISVDCPKKADLYRRSEIFLLSADQGSERRFQSRARHFPVGKKSLQIEQSRVSPRREIQSIKRRFREEINEDHVISTEWAQHSLCVGRTLSLGGGAPILRITMIGKRSLRSETKRTGGRSVLSNRAAGVLTLDLLVSNLSLNRVYDHAMVFDIEPFIEGLQGSGLRPQFRIGIPQS